MAEEQELPTRPPSVMEDPSAQAIARTYADAFLNAAAGTGVDDALEEFASFVADVLDANPKFEAILLSGIVRRDEKIKLIDRAIAPYGSELFVNFLRVLAQHDRLELLPMILGESQVRHEVRTGRQRVQVTSAQPLSEETRNDVRKRLAESLPFEPILEERTDPAVLGGLVIQVGDTVYDSSLRTRLKQLRRRLRERSLNEIQSGRDRFSHPEGD